MLDWPLFNGWSRTVIAVIGVVSAVYLVSGRSRRWWLVTVPLALAIGVLGTAVVKLVVDVIWQPFPQDPLPGVALIAAGAITTALVLTVAKVVRWRQRMIAVAAVLGILIVSASVVNEHFAQYPTLRAVFGADLDNQVDFDKDFVSADQLIAAPDSGDLSAVWKPPAGMPTEGSVTSATIPGTVSGFVARDAWIYLPPAYRTTPRAELPLLIMMAGQPGTPRDWFDGGKLGEVMDVYAAGHQGLAPVVVVVDNTGDPFTNPACVDSPKGKVQTYLTIDLPTWIRDNLQVDPDTRHWAVGGLSSGGTCALALAVNAADVYRTFVTISGEDEITIGDRAKTLAALFGGSQAAFDAVDPLTVMKTHSFPDTAGYVVGGKDDPYLPQAQRVAAAAKAAGMTIEYVELPGAHEWRVWGAGLELALPWLAVRLGLVA